MARVGCIDRHLIHFLILIKCNFSFPGILVKLVLSCVRDKTLNCKDVHITINNKFYRGKTLSSSVLTQISSQPKKNFGFIK